MSHTKYGIACQALHGKPQVKTQNMRHFHIYKITLSCMAFAAALALPQMASAQACTQNSNTVGLLGLDGSDGRIYVDVSGHDNGCGCNAFRFIPGTTNTTKAALAVLLTARSAGKKVRVDLAEAANCNSASRVYVQPD